MNNRNGIAVSIVIKAFNEAEHIADAIESALAATDRVGGEVIVADSASTDRTVEIAERYPVSIVKLARPRDRRCGAGPQLGYQVARGDFVYILDGDMILDPGFLPAALDALANDSSLGGVAGIVRERSDANYQFRARQKRRTESIPGECRSLDMGGLYRREALDSVGYFSDRNLHAYEEYELGLRLRDAGWRLERLPVASVIHHGHTDGNFALLRKRWRSRYIDGGGELLRQTLGRHRFIEALWSQKHLVVALAVWCLLAFSLVRLPYQPGWAVLWLCLVAALVGWRTIRLKSLADAAFAQVVWQVTAIAMLRGFFSGKVDPRLPLDYVLVKDPAANDTSAVGRAAAVR